MDIAVPSSWGQRWFLSAAIKHAIMRLSGLGDRFGVLISSPYLHRLHFHVRWIAALWLQRHARTGSRPATPATSKSTPSDAISLRCRRHCVGTTRPPTTCRHWLCRLTRASAGTSAARAACETTRVLILTHLVTPALAYRCAVAPRLPPLPRYARSLRTTTLKPRPLHHLPS